MNTLSSSRVRLRAAQPGDRDRVSAFLTRLSPESMRARYMGPALLKQPILDRELSRMLDFTQSNHTVVVAIDDGDIRGIGEFVKSEIDGNRAEVALMVEDAFQGRGMGTSLFLELEQRALDHGIVAFTGEVANDNWQVMAMLRRADRIVRMQPGYASTYFQMLLHDAQAPEERAA